MEEREYLDYLSLHIGLYNQIESDVADLLLELNIRSYPVDPVEIALSLGYELIPFSKMSKEARKMLFFKEADAISYYDQKKNTFVIYYRPDGLKERFRFTIGHEIGHIRMGHKGESELARRIADYYSAYLLAPSPWIGKSGCEDFKEVATAFCLSEVCASRCFDRYQHWCKIRYTKDYEKTLLRFFHEIYKRTVMHIAYRQTKRKHCIDCWGNQYSAVLRILLSVYWYRHDSTFRRKMQQKSLKMRKFPLQKCYAKNK